MGPSRATLDLFVPRTAFRRAGLLMPVLLAVLLAVTGVAAVPATPVAVAAPAAPPAAPIPAAPAPAGTRLPVKVLVFHGAADDAVADAAVAAIERLGRTHRFGVDQAADGAAFTPANLARYRAVIFLSAAGEGLTAEQEAAFQAYIQGGGGFLGVHDAARAQPGSTWFTGLVGARPGTSPSDAQRAVVEVGDRIHPATRDLPLEWTRTDVWFNWATSPSGAVHTVAGVRERSYTPGNGANGPHHPISWCRDFDGGRSFYTGMGGTAASYADGLFRRHLLGAIQWTSGMVRGDCQATIAANYEATRLTRPNETGRLDQIGEPHGLTIAPDGRVFYIGRGGPMTGGPTPITDWNNPDIGKGFGTIHVWDPKTNEVSQVANLDVFGNKGGGPELNKTEEGLVGITLDPNFARNHWIYVFYMPHSSIDRENRVGQRTISRFTFDEESGELDLSSEKVLLRWAVQIDRCCHVGGGMGFDRQGNLYVSTGDNNSSQCDGCAPAPSGYSGNNPVPAFAGISQQDARRTAGNTNDLNGKILRIHPEPDGTYTIPRGNLFTGREQGGGKTRPEIYVMGVRNPTRLAVDPKTNWLLAGWVGPDANNPDTTWGPAKYETAAVITKAGNRGWPYCMGDKQPYRDRNLPDITKPLGWYDCDHPRNDSPRNTGLVDLPPVQSNNIWYSPQGGGPVYERDASGIPIYDLAHQTLTEPYFPGGAGQAIMPGPMYRFDAKTAGTGAWPRYWDGKWFIGDETRSAVRVAVTMDPKTAPAGGAPVHADDIRQIVPSSAVGNLMDWKFGPDGALYVLDYGSGFFNATARSALWRITYKGGAPTPAPAPAVAATAQHTPMKMAFSAGRSGGVAYRWDFGDGTPPSHEADPTHYYATGGDFTATLTVTYADGAKATARTAVKVGCPAPDARPTVRMLDTDSKVDNVDVGGGCTINDAIDDESVWSSRGAFQRHVGAIATSLRRRGVIGGAALALLAATATRSGVGAPHGPDAYLPIFDGTRESLAKWEQAPGGSFTLQDDGTIRSVGGLGMLWYADKEFGDFSLRLQFRDARTDGSFSNSGVFVRFPDPRIPLDQRPPGSCGTVGAAQTQQAWVAIFCGQEIQIYDGPTGEPQKTGSVYNFQPLNLDQARPTPAGVWNDYEVRVTGQHYTIIRNGVVINEFDNTPGKTSSRAGDPPTDLRQFVSGFIGLQNHGNSDLIEFRNVRIRNLNTATS
ncbi:MAG TPA: ThuA domain-containing protein [Streptosporangiaceae bacterium]|nr:ThuA domain-containing protein [Streptosporangiaceae bacterium]